MKETEQLVQLQNGVATTTSLQVAETFGKNHQHVLETIKNLTVENSTVKNMFSETTYVNTRGREYPMYQMNKDGFTLLVMGYTGQKATEFKLRYIQAFNEMEEALKNESSQLRLPKNSTEMMQVVQSVNEETNKRIDQVEDTVDELKDRFGLPSMQALQLLEIRKKHVTTLLGGHDSNAYTQLNRKTFAQFGSDFKQYFGVPRYDTLPLSKLDEGIAYTKAWQLPTNLALEVRELNLQTELDV